MGEGRTERPAARSPLRGHRQGVPSGTRAAETHHAQVSKSPRTREGDSQAPRTSILSSWGTVTLSLAGRLGDPALPCALLWLPQLGPSDEGSTRQPLPLEFVLKRGDRGPWPGAVRKKCAWRALKSFTPNAFLSQSTAESSGISGRLPTSFSRMKKLILADVSCRCSLISGCAGQLELFDGFPQDSGGLHQGAPLVRWQSNLQYLFNAFSREDARNPQTHTAKAVFPFQHR